MVFNERSLMDARDPRTGLAEVDAARRAAAAASATPMRTTVLLCLILGLGAGLMAMLEPLGVVAGIAMLGAGFVLDARTKRRRGQITDGRAVAARLGWYAATLLVPMFVGQWVIRALNWPLRGVVFGAVMAVGGFVYLRLDERYQLRRFAEGDVKPGDVT